MTSIDRPDYDGHGALVQSMNLVAKAAAAIKALPSWYPEDLEPVLEWLESWKDNDWSWAEQEEAFAFLDRGDLPERFRENGRARD